MYATALIKFKRGNGGFGEFVTLNVQLKSSESLGPQNLKNII